MSKTRVVAILVALLATAGPPLAPAADPPVSEQAAFLFAYRPDDIARFEEGYRRHLEWHRKRSDPLVWYGWNVIVGDDTGLFVDGTFGLAFGDFDDRIDPAGDAADFAETTAPFGKTVYRRVYRLRPDLSTATPLEDRQPSRQLRVTRFVVQAGRESRFEAIVEAIKPHNRAPETWYELVEGGRHAGYLLMVPRDGWGDISSPFSLADRIEAAISGDARTSLLDDLADSVRKVESEVWLLRPDLSYLPGRPSE